MIYLVRSRVLAAAVGLSAALALVPGSAEARFGKSSSSSNSSSSSSSSSSGGSRATSSHNHAATPVESNDANGGGSSSGGSSYSYSPRYGVYSPWGCWSGDPACAYRHGYWFGYQPWVGYDEPRPMMPPPEVTQPARPAAFSFGAVAQGYVGGGAGFGLSLALEHDRLGLRGDFNGIFVPADDGSDLIDSIKLLDLHLTYALLANEHGRLRVGAGMNSAFAPDIIMAGPGMSISGVMGLLGPVSGEAMAQLTPFPFLQIDWSVGLSLAMGPVGMRAGWRRIYLNDNGFVDGIAHADLFDGPYVALALSL